MEETKIDIEPRDLRKEMSDFKSLRENFKVVRAMTDILELPYTELEKISKSIMDSAKDIYYEGTRTRADGTQLLTKQEAEDTVKYSKELSELIFKFSNEIKQQELGIKTKDMPGLICQAKNLAYNTLLSFGTMIKYLAPPTMGAVSSASALYSYSNLGESPLTAFYAALGSIDDCTEYLMPLGGGFPKPLSVDTCNSLLPKNIATVAHALDATYVGYKRGAELFQLTAFTEKTIAEYHLLIYLGGALLAGYGCYNVYEWGKNRIEMNRRFEANKKIIRDNPTAVSVFGSALSPAYREKKRKFDVDGGSRRKKATKKSKTRKEKVTRSKKEKKAPKKSSTTSKKKAPKKSTTTSKKKASIKNARRKTVTKSVRKKDTRTKHKTPKSRQQTKKKSQRHK